MTEISRLEAVVTADTSAASRDLAAFGGTIDQTVQKGGGLGGMLGGIASAASGLIIGEGLMRLPGLLMNSVGAAQESAANVAQLNAVIASTGGVAGVSAQAAQELATKWMNLANVDDDVVLAGENMLLTFTNIGSEVFPGATEAALNMSVALKEDVGSAAMQLGKALQDPITGATALRRVGVALTDQQQDQIKAFVESGDIMSAQKIILNELKTEFGGAAEAIGQSKGPLEAVKVQFGEFQETLGAAVIPALASLGASALGAFDSFAKAGGLDAVMQGLTTTTMFAGGAITSAFNAIGNAAQSELGQKVIGAVEIIAGAISGLVAGDFPVFIQTLEDGFGIDLSPVVAGWNLLTAAWQMAGEIFQTFIQALQGDWAPDPNLIAPLTNAIGILATIITGQVIPAIGQLATIGATYFTQFVAVVQMALGGDFIGAITAFLTLLGSVEAMLLPILASWVAAFIGWIAPMIPPFLAAMSGFLVQFGGWLLTVALPAIAAQLLVWGQAFIDWIAPMIPPMLLALGELMVQFGAWLLAQIPVLTAQLLLWGNEFVAWIPIATPLLLEAAGVMLIAFTAWIEAGAPGLTEKLLTWGAAFVSWVVPATGKLLLALGQMQLDIGTWITTKAAPAILTAAVQIGTAIINGVVQGLIPFAARLQTSLIDSARNALTGARNNMGSTAEEYAAVTLGSPLAEGIITGLIDTFGNGSSRIGEGIRAVVETAISNNINPLIALALAKAESSLNPGAIGDFGTSKGLFQLHQPGQGSGMTDAEMFDPWINAKKFLGPNAAKYAELAATLQGAELARAFGSAAEVSDPALAGRYADAYNELAAVLGPMTAGLSGAAVQTDALAAAATASTGAEQALTAAGGLKTAMVTTQTGALGQTAAAGHELAAANVTATSAELAHTGALTAQQQAFVLAMDSSGTLAGSLFALDQSDLAAAVSAAQHTGALTAQQQAFVLANDATGLLAGSLFALDGTDMLRALNLTATVTPAHVAQTAAVTLGTDATMTAITQDVLWNEQLRLAEAQLLEGTTPATGAQTDALVLGNDATAKAVLADIEWNKQLRDAQEAMTKGTTPATGAQTAAITKTTDATLLAVQADIEWNKALRDAEKQVGNTTDAIDDMAKAIKDASKLVGSAAGSAINNAFKILGKAGGGSVSADMTYLVGERGPELFTPGRSGTITPNDQLSIGGSSPIVINIGSVDSTERVREIEAVVRRAVQAGGKRLGL